MNEVLSKSFSNHRIVLASASPRRYQLLKALGFDLQVIDPDVDETQLKGEAPHEMVVRLAKLKAQTVQKKLTDSPDFAANVDIHFTVGSAIPMSAIPIVAADSIICLNDNIVLGKPKDRDDAIRMLSFLSGKEHEVMTGFAVRKGTEERSGIVKTQVSFRDLHSEQILAYVDTGEPMDKAGSYAIQGGGASLVDVIRGSYTNIMGLPVKEVVLVLEEFAS